MILEIVEAFHSCRSLVNETHSQIADIASVLAQISLLGDTLKNVDTTDISSKLVAIQTTLQDGLSTQSYDLSQVAGMPPLLRTTTTATATTTTTTTAFSYCYYNYVILLLYYYH